MVSVDNQTVDAMFTVAGDGLWCNPPHPHAVPVTAFTVLGWYDVYELRVQFDHTVWRCQQHGLIYTDSEFECCVRDWLQSQCLQLDDWELSYSEQGMQGRDYVSFDISARLADQWRKRCFMVFAG